MKSAPESLGNTAREGVRYGDAPPPTGLPDIRPSDYPRSMLFAVAFVSLLICFDLFQRIAWLMSRDVHHRTVDLLNLSLVKLLAIIRVQVEFPAELSLDPGRPVIVVSNHQSLLDIPILHSIFYRQRPRFIAKKELAHWIPSVSFNLRNGGNCIIDRANGQQAVQAIAGLGQAIEQDHSCAIIFPEGTRARDGRLKKFRAAGLATLLEQSPSAQLIPVTIENSWFLQARRFGPLPSGFRIRVTVAPALDRRSISNPGELCEHAERTIALQMTAYRS